MLKEKDLEKGNVETRICKMCGCITYVKLTEKEEAQYHHYLHERTPNKLIQEYMPKTDTAIREYLRGKRSEYDICEIYRNRESYCSDCMKKLFGKTSSRIKKYSPKETEMLAKVFVRDMYDNMY